MYQLVLASESPRRKQLLKEAGFHFTVHPAKLSEIPDKNLNVKEQILSLARQKAEAVAQALSDKDSDSSRVAAGLDPKQPILVLAADTEVIFEDAPLGKPADEESAFKMLKKLSGLSHQVITAMAIKNLSSGEVLSHIETSDVHFRELTDQEIWSYIKTGEGRDKAGSYAIQGLGRSLVQSYKGSWQNIVGLPVAEFKIILSRSSWTLAQDSKSQGLLQVKEQIEISCQKSNRLPTDVLLLAVSKLQPEEKISDLYELGQRHFAENYVQEALAKIENLKDKQDIEWHLIGHLQKNKCKYVVGKFNLIHSVDSLDLAKALDKECAKRNLTQKVLLQVNVAAEESKSGFSLENFISTWPELSKLQNLEFEGLMTMPPLNENPESNRVFFQELRNLLFELRKMNNKACHTLKHLSIGTSHDYHIAIEEGATILRLGTVLFGERPAKVQ